MTLSIIHRLPLLPRWFCGAAILALCAACAHGEQEVPLWEGTPPGLHHTKPEASEDRAETGRLDRYLSYVSTPTLTLYPAPGVKSANTTVLVVPGGGFRYVCIDKEGIEVAKWLNSIGINVAVLKYRTTDLEQERTFENILPVFGDVRRAMKVLRAHADQWGIDPKRLGLMGFSAGGIMSVYLVGHPEADTPKSDDPVEKLSSRPDFLAVIYGSIPPKSPNPDKSWPPVFIAHAADDPKAPALIMAKAYSALLQAGVPAEIHIFRTGDHGFGVSPKKGAVRNWTHLYADWLRDLGYLAEK